MVESTPLDRAQVRFDEAKNLGKRRGPAALAEYVLTRLLLGTVSRLPHFMQNVAGDIVARLAVRFDRRHRDAARRFMSQALGQESTYNDRRLLGAYKYLFRISIDSCAFDRKVPQESLLEHYEITAVDGVMEALAGTGGGIMVTPHVGDWEAGAAVMPHIGMVPAYVLARPPKNGYLSRYLLRVRERKNLTVIPRRGGMRQIASILEGGGWIGMLLDQRPRGKHVVAPFFGRLARCERSAAVLMKRLGVPIVFGSCYLTDRPFQYRLEFTRLVEPSDLAKFSIDEIVALLNREQEKLILKHPEQYFWLHDRYRDAPVESPDQPLDQAPGPVEEEEVPGADVGPQKASPGMPRR